MKPDRRRKRISEYMMAARIVGAFAFLVWSQALSAGYCPEHIWTLSQIANAPVLAVGRVVSLRMANGPHFSGDPKDSAPAQEMTAEVEVLRSMPAGATPKLIEIHFTGRDGPDFSWCPEALPSLPIGQVLLLPLNNTDSWHLLGRDGPFMVTRVAADVRAPALTIADPRSFITHEVANSFLSADPVARYSAAALLAREADYLEPELTSQVESVLKNDDAGWTRVLAAILIARDGALGGVALAKLSRKDGDFPVWRALMDDLSAYADEPYHPLFSYDEPFALYGAVFRLATYSNNAEFIARLKSALREDRAGSSFLASRIIDEGNPTCLPEALDRAMKVMARPTSGADDIVASVTLILKYGSGAQRRQYFEIARSFDSSNPDYGAYLARVAR